MWRCEERSRLLEGRGIRAFRDLLRGVEAIELLDAVHRREQIAINEDSESSAKNPVFVRRPGKAKSRAYIVGVLRKGSGQAVVFIAKAVVEGKGAERCPVILNVGSAAKFGKIRVGIAEALGIEGRLAVGERGQVRKHIDASKPVQISGTQSNVVDRHTRLEKMLAILADHAIAKIDVRFVAAAVSGIGRAELGKPGDHDSGPADGARAQRDTTVRHFKVQLIQQSGR